MPKTFGFCRNHVAYFVCALILSACGGGSGGGGGNNGTPGNTGTPGVVAPVLSFTPAAAKVTVAAGRAAILNIDANVNTPGDFAAGGIVYTYIIDTTGVISPDVQITQRTATTYSTLMRTLPSLAEGKYAGNFTVRVCKDSACNQHYPGSPVLLPYEITVLAANATPLSVGNGVGLSASLFAGAAVPGPTNVNVRTGNTTWTASTTQTWINLNKGNASGTGNGTFSFTYNTAGLSTGDHTGAITVSTGDGQTQTISVRLQLLPPSFTVDRGNIIVNAINGAPIPDQPIKFDVSGAAAQWSIASNVPWLSATPGSGTTPALTSVRLNPAVNKLASGAYTGQLTLSGSSVAALAIPVSLTLTKPTLKTSARTLTLGGIYGRDNDAAALTLNLNTLTNSFPWNLSALPSWVSANAVSGTVNQTGSTINFAQVANKVPPGTSTAEVTVSVEVNGDALSTPLTLVVNRDQHKLLFSEVGVGMASTPGWSRLTRTLKVRDNFGQTPTWSVSSDRTWLSVERNGDQLTLRANPAGLPDDTISYATVKLSSPDSSISTAEPLRVAIWKGKTTPSQITKLSKNYSYLQTDPIRPLLYAHNGGTAIDVYNVYSATLVTTIGNLGGKMGKMAISPNGDSLFSYDTENKNIIVVDLSSLTKRASWPFSQTPISTDGLLAIRPNGVELLIGPGGQAYLTATGTVIGNTPLSGSLTATSDGTRVYSQDSGYSPASVAGYSIDYTALGGGTLHSARMSGSSFINNASNGRDIAVSADGTHLYTASGAPYRCSSVKPDTLGFIASLPGGDAYPNNVEVDVDGRVYCGISGWYSPADVWIHSADGVLLKQVKFAGYAKELRTGTLKISADGFIMVGQTDDPLLVFVPVGP